jgi:hypothetical protein
MQPDQGQPTASAGPRPAGPQPSGPQSAAQGPPPSGTSAGAGSERKVFRLPGAVIAWWGWVVVAVFCLIDMAVTGRNHTSAEIAVTVLLVTGVMYACALRPKVVTDSGGITVQNPLRDHRVPWGSVTSIDLAESVRVHTEREPGAKREKVIHSWALYAQPRSKIRAEMLKNDPRRLPRSPFTPDSGSSSSSREPGAQVMVKQLSEIARDARDRGALGGPHVVTWSWWSVAAMVGPAVALILVITLLH